MADERASRKCDKCGVEDTHSHHVQYVAFNHPSRGPIDLSVTKHVQCCAEDGCEICSIDVEHAGKQLGDTSPSDEFTAFMQSKPPELLEALAAASVETE